jgi:hypothetical protein
MNARTFGATGFAIFWLSALAGTATAWEKEEHRQVADSALAAVLAECGVAMQDSFTFAVGRDFSIRLEKSLWENKTFGEICAWFSGKDVARSRVHERARTILQQIQSLPSALIEAAWQKHGVSNASAASATSSWPAVKSAELSQQNVVVNYLLHHLMALRFAEMAGQAGSTGEETLRRALIYEAMALGYLSDAFSAGHLLASQSDALSGLHWINNKQAHDFYTNEGVYVINSRGDAWQTFGDKQMRWHAPTYRPVLEACTTSLRELFLVYYASAGSGAVPESLKKWWQAVSADTPVGTIVSAAKMTQDGEKYYSTTRLPALLLLPMPVSATWSKRTDKADEHGIHPRKHYPQLREAGFHDPDLATIDTEFLYPRAAVDSSMFLAFLSSQSAKDLIKSHPDIASVRYVQERNFPPSFIGPLLSVGGGMAFKEGERGSGTAIGLGYGFFDDYLFVKKFSLEIALMPSLHERRRTLLASALGLGIKLPWSAALHTEGGHAWGLRAPFEAHGWKFAAGIDSPTIPLGFTYAGLTARLQYQWLWLDPTLHGAFIELILH